MRAVRREVYKPFRPKKRSLRQVDFHGRSFIVFANEDVGWRIIAQRDYEWNEIQCFQRLIRKDDVCVDAGANIGIYSVFMAEKAHKGRIISFEPVTINQRILALNAALNGLTNVEVRDSLLSDVAGTVEFSVSEDSAYSSIRPTNRKKEARTLRVQADTLDDLFAERGQRVDVIKIDVEGAELLVLKGGEKLLSTPELRPRVLLVELASDNQAVYNYRPEEVTEYLRGLGYSVFSIVNGDFDEGWSREKGSIEAVFLLEDDPSNPRASVT